MDDTENVESLALVLVKTLDLDIEHRRRVDLVAQGVLDVVREALLVTLLDRYPPFLERRIFRMFE